MGMIPDQDKEFLRGKFSEELESPVTVVAFTEKTEGLAEPGLECKFCSETEQLVSEVTELSDKLRLDVRKFSADDQTAKDMGIDKLPALVLTSDESSNVRYFGVPGGFEFNSFVEDIVDVSRNATSLSQAVKDKIRRINRDVHIQVFVTPTCPYCSSAVRIAHQMAIENPTHIKADAIEVAEFPHLVERYDISAVPTVVINDKVQFEGALSSEDFAERVAKTLAT